MSNVDKLRSRYEKLYGIEPVSSSTLSELQNRLRVVFPADFREISRFYSGGFLGGISHHAIEIDTPADSILDETLRLRSFIGLDDSFIFLAEPPESIILMRTGPKPYVAWCDAVEVSQVLSGNFTNEPLMWNTYADFFEYMLKTEEEDRLQ